MVITAHFFIYIVIKAKSRIYYNIFIFKTKAF